MGWDILENWTYIVIRQANNLCLKISLIIVLGTQNLWPMWIHLVNVAIYILHYTIEYSNSSIYHWNIPVENIITNSSTYYISSILRTIWYHMLISLKMGCVLLSNKQPVVRWQWWYSWHCLYLNMGINELSSFLLNSMKFSPTVSKPYAKKHNWRQEKLPDMTD